MKHHLRVKIDLLTLLVQKDLRVRYRGSIFGYLWSLLNPLLYMSVLSVVFSYVLRFKIEHYPIFLLCGIVSWNLLHQSLMQGVHSIEANGGLIKKVKLPIALFPSATVLSVTVHFALSMFSFLGIAFFFGHWPRIIWLLLPFYFAVFLVFIWGATLLIASLNVVFKDIGHSLDPILQLLFYATPIIYPVDVLPEKVRVLIALNPVTHYIDTIRSIFFYYQVPSLQTTSYCLATSFLSVVLGVLTYRKLRGNFVYQL